MAKDADVLIQLATRIPRSLHREIKVHCVANGISVMEFVATALETRLRQTRAAKKTPPAR
jgi:predicted HicB family RNase H-like nuclease